MKISKVGSPPLLVALATILHSAFVASFSYAMLPTIGSALHDFTIKYPKTYVETRSLGCTLTSDTPILDDNVELQDPLFSRVTGSQKGSKRTTWGGMVIHQDQWSPPVEWIGFWDKSNCQWQLPMLVIHWYPDAPTDQIFNMIKLKDYIPGFKSGDLRFLSWGEITNLPPGFVNHVPPGSIALREGRPRRITGKDAAWYQLFEDFIVIQSSPPDEITDQLARYNIRGSGRKGKEFHITSATEFFTRSLEGPGGTDYPIGGEQDQESRSPLLQGSMGSPRSDQDSSTSVFPEVTLQIGIEPGASSEEAESISSNAEIQMERQIESSQNQTMQEEITSLNNDEDRNQVSDNNQLPINPGSQTGPLQNAPAGALGIQESIEENSQRNSQARQLEPQQQVQIPESVETQAILGIIGTSFAEVIRVIETSGVDAAILFLLNKLAEKRLNIEKRFLTADELNELASHPASQLKPFALANTLAEVRFRRGVKRGSRQPEDADIARAELSRTVDAERDVAQKAVGAVLARMRALAGNPVSNTGPYELEGLTESQDVSHIPINAGVQRNDEAPRNVVLLENEAFQNGRAESPIQSSINNHAEAVRGQNGGSYTEPELSVQGSTAATVADAQRTGPSGEMEIEREGGSLRGPDGLTDLEREGNIAYKTLGASRILENMRNQVSKFVTFIEDDDVKEEEADSEEQVNEGSKIEEEVVQGEAIEEENFDAEDTEEEAIQGPERVATPSRANRLQEYSPTVINLQRVGRRLYDVYEPPTLINLQRVGDGLYDVISSPQVAENLRMIGDEASEEESLRSQPDTEDEAYDPRKNNINFYRGNRSRRPR